MASAQNLLNPSLRGLKLFPPKEIISNEAYLRALTSFAKGAESAKSPEKLLELENFLRGLYYGLENDLTDEDKITLVERVVQPLMNDPSWRRFYNLAKSGGNGGLVERPGSINAGDSSLIGVLPYIIDDYKYLRARNPQFQVDTKNTAS
ncbi:hypothetical protein BJ165DRAFT_1462740 [Panaeolus papilionaceus]|nr:hypothetical protein BJ165DRAFT_1462740 [Panaeolus papilionaceus]